MQNTPRECRDPAATPCSRVSRLWVRWLQRNLPAILFAVGLAVFTGGLTATVWATTPQIGYNFDYDHDGMYYGTMAGSKLFDVRFRYHAPWCWRVLTPFLASLMPFRTLTSFIILAFLSNWTSLLLLFGVLHRSGCSRRLALVGLLGYAGVFWTLKFSFYSPAYVDYQAQTFTLVILFFTLGRQYWAPPLLLPLAVLQRESALALAPIVYAHFASRYAWRSRRSLIYLGLGLLAAPLLALIALRLLIQPVNQYHPLGVLRNLYAVATPGFWPRFVQEIFSGLGLLPLILIYGHRQVRSYLRGNPHWLLLIGIGVLLLFGGVDKGRLFLYMLPGVVVCATLVIRDATRACGSVWRGGAWVALTLLLHFYLGNYLSPMGNYPQYLARLVPMSAPGITYLDGLGRSVIVAAIWCGATLLICDPSQRRQIAKS